MKFRTKPIVIEAFQYLKEPPPTWWSVYPGIEIEVNTAMALIPVRKGVMRASPGDWIIRGVNGDVYPVKDYIFRTIFEAVE